MTSPVADVEFTRVELVGLVAAAVVVAAVLGPEALGLAGVESRWLAAASAALLGALAFLAAAGTLAAVKSR